MRIVHILRKPLSEGTVAANVLKHGAGGLNIDASRVHGGPSSGGSVSGSTALGQGSGWNTHANRTTQVDRSMPSGRWPANVILQHLDGCRCDGTKKVGSGLICAEGCPVARLDEQSGVLAPQGGQKHKDTKEGSFLDTGFGGSPTSSFYGDKGGASRFFKQVGGTKDSG
jgi:hypothetical protein